MFHSAIEGTADAAREIREAIEGKTVQWQEASEPEVLRVVEPILARAAFPLSS
jgi:hypothetical protein